MKNPIAFPNTELNAYGKFYEHHKGMTLRDYFAAKAMQAMISRESPSDGWSEGASRQCYTIADLMLTEREK